MGEAVRRAGSGRRSPEAVRLGAQDGHDQRKDNIERLVLEAAKAEGENPSTENLPPSGEMIARHRVDDMGARVTEFHGRESFIKSMGREGRRVRCIRDPRSGQAIWGNPLPQAR
jgi:hypothetical protein